MSNKASNFMIVALAAAMLLSTFKQPEVVNSFAQSIPDKSFWGDSVPSIMPPVTENRSSWVRLRSYGTPLGESVFAGRFVQTCPRGQFFFGASSDCQNRLDMLTLLYQHCQLQI